MKNSTKFLSFNCAGMDYLPDSNLCKLSNFGNKNEANCMPNVLNRMKMWMGFMFFFLFSASMQTFSQNLLSNNSFDSGTTGWSASPSGSIFTFSGQYAYSGNALTLNNNNNWGNYYTWQSITATAGIKYNISFMASTHNPVYYAAVGYEFYNSSGIIIGSRVEKRVTGSVYNSSGYSKYEFLGVTAPTGTTKLRVVGYTNGTALKLDNISVSLTSTCSNVTSGGTIGSNQTGCSGFDPVTFTSVTAPAGGAGTLEIIWMKSTTSSVLNSTTQSQWTVIPGATGLTYDAGPITQTTYFTRCSRRAGCTAYVGEANVITATVNTNCQGKDPVCLSRKSAVSSSSLCGDATKSYGLWFNDLKSSNNVTCPSQYFTVKSGELTEFCDGTAILKVVGCVTGGGASDCITATVNYSGRTGTPPTGSPLTNTHCSGYAPNVGNWYYYPTSNGTFSGTGIFAGLAGTYTQNMAAFQVGTGGSLNDISKFGASSWFKINLTSGGTNNWTTASKDGDININLGTATNIASVTATANPNSICKGSNVVLTATLDAASKSANCSPTYSWVGSNGFTSTQATVTNTSVQTATTYTVTVTFTAKNGSKCSVTGTTAVALSANCCDNVTNGGQIGGNQRNCGAFDPAAFTNVTLPSGGTGTLEYLWLKSTTASTYTDANASEWIPIVGSNSATLDLNNISQTTYFQRCSRRAGCTDYVGETNVVSVIIDPLPTAPTVTPASICGTGTVTLGATCGTGTTAMWYSALTGGTSIASGASFTTPSLSATTTYYVSCKSSAGCESGRTSVKATVTPKITDGGKIQADETICTGSTPSKITNVTLPNGGVGSIEYLWLQTTSLTNGVCPANIAGQTLYSPISNSNGSEYQPGAITTTTCFIRCSRLTGCTDYTGESNVIKKTVGSIGVAPTVTPASICGTGTVTLGATCGTGTTAMWYSALTGGTSIGSGASFTTPSLSATTTYYVSCKSSAGCESGRTSVKATVTPKITDGGKIQADETICTGSTPSKITNVTLPNGGVGSIEYLWLQTTSLTNGVCPANIAGQTLYSPIANTNTSEYQPGAITTTTCYIRCSRLTGCTDYTGESNVIKKTVGSIGVAPTVTPASICGTGTVTLGATCGTGTTAMWYSALTGGTSIGSGASFTTPSLSATTTYYVSCKSSAGCESGRTSVVATVNGGAAAPTVTPASICGTGTVTLGATCSTGATAMWYSALTGGTSIASGVTYTTPSLTATTTYYVSCKSSAGCESARTSVVATVNGSLSGPSAIKNGTICGNGPVELGAICTTGTPMWYAKATGGTSFTTGSVYVTPVLTTTTSYYVSCKSTAGCESPRIEVKATVIAKITNGGTIQADESICLGKTPAQITSVTPATGGDANVAIEYIWLQTTSLSNGACPLNVVGQNLYTEIPNSNTPNYQPGAITQTTCYIRCARRAGCTDYIGGESNTVKKSVLANCEGKDPVCLSRKTTVSNSTLCGDATQSYGLYFADLKGNVVSPNQHFTVKSGELTEFCDGTAVLNYTACVTGGTSSDCINVIVNYSGRTGTPPTGSPVANTHCTGYSPNLGDWYYYPTSNGTFTGAGIYAGLTGTYTQNMAAFQLGTGASLNDITKFGASSWFKINITNGGTNNWTTVSKDGDINVTLGTPTTIASVTATANPTAICTGGDVNLTATLDANSKSINCTPTYSWVGSNGFTSTQATVTNTNVTASTTYTVTVTFTAANGSKCSVMATTGVTINPTPATPTVASGSICGTGTVTLGATCSTGATAMWYSALTGGTSMASGASFTTPSLSASTTYYVSCKSNAGCESARTPVAATVNGSASAPTVTPATTCGAGSVTLGATCSAGVATWYSALTGGTAIASGASYTTPNLTTTTTYYVSCKAGTGCESARTAVVATVVAKITNGGTIKADETLCGSGTPAKITNVTSASGGDASVAIEYLWLQTTTLSNGACPLNIIGQNLYTEIPNTNTADYQPGAITQTTCYIRCARRAGCTDYIGGESNTVKKTVTTPFTVTPSTNANAVCAGTTVSITLSTTATGTVSYSWTGPNGFTANTKDVVIANSTIANNGVYTVSVSNGTGCSAVATVNVKITNCLKLGDAVFNDKNNNGKQDAGELGIANVSVKLYDSANNLVGTATTDANGKYLFSNLAPNDYVVEISAPTGYKSSTGTVGSATGSAEPAVDPDNNIDADDNGTTVSGQTIRTKPVTLTVAGGDNLTVDFGLFKPAQIGDYVFRDSNGNGKQDVGEGGVSGVTVKLYDSTNNVIATTTTDANGKYLFDNLIAGNYTVEFVKSTIGSGFNFSPKGATTSDKDSDADLTTGKTTVITLTEGQVNKDIDAGVTTPCDTDTTPPVLSTCPADIIIKTRGTSAIITWTEPTATDNCGTVVLTSTSVSGGQFPVGTTTVIYTATDAKGNKATCSFVVNVVKMVTCDVDTQAPVFYDCPTDISVVTTGTTAVVLWDHPAVGDNCGIPEITYNFEPGMLFPVGITTVTYKAVDAKGNTSYCSFKVTVTKKTTTSTLTNAVARVAVTEEVTFADNVTIYPNPSNADCSIELSAELMRANKSVEVSILSAAGNVEFAQTATGTERTSVKVPVENMPSGTYFVNVGLENGRMIIKKLQIVK